MPNLTFTRILKYVLTGLGGLLLIAAWLAWPAYGFFSHRDAAPMPPFGWVALPDGTAPVVSELGDDRLVSQAEEALARMEAWRESIGAPAMSAAVSIDGDVVWRGSAGWSDLGREIPATPDTAFRIGSTSKAITATALARLVDRGVIDLDAPISSWIDDLPNEAWNDLTPRQLASHTSGMPHYGENTDRMGLYRSLSMNGQFDTPRDALRQFDDSELLFAPGTRFHYSSFGTVLLGAVIAEAAGAPYEEVVTAEVLQPAGMTNTFVDPGLRPDRDLFRSGRFARSYYTPAPQTGQVRPWRPVDLSGRLPGGGWASTPTDLVRMGDAMLDTRFVSAATRQTFWTPQILSDGSVNEQIYALGWRWREWEVDGVGIARNANHGGVSRGAQAWLLVFPELDMSIAFTINGRTAEFAEFGLFFRELVEVFGPVAAERAGLQTAAQEPTPDAD